MSNYDPMYGRSGFRPINGTGGAIRRHRASVPSDFDPKDPAGIGKMPGFHESGHFGLPKVVNDSDKAQSGRDRMRLPAITHPRDLLAIREAVTGVMGNTNNPRDIDPEFRGWLAAPEAYEMYFTRPDFADLYAEVRSTVVNMEDFSFMEDIAKEKGDHGAMIIAFDERHQPAMPMLFRMSPALDTATKMLGQEPFEDAQERRPTPAAWVVYAWESIGGSIAATSMVIPGRTVNTTGLISSDDAATTEAAVIAWMMLAGQQTMLERTVVTAGKGLPPKAKKNLGAAGKKANITVVDLRRTIRKQIDDVAHADARHLDHRFIVRGHWRNQACGAGRREHRLTWVAPYIKGDPSLPFIKREKVFKF